MNRFFLSLLVLFFSLGCFAQSDLPPCPKGQKASWNNCFGTHVFPDGEKYVGEYKDGQRHGQGISSFASGDKYLGEWREDKFNGQGTLIYANGNKHVGEWKDGQRNGQGTTTFFTGNKYVGDFKGDTRNGKGAFTFANGERHVHEWKDKPPDGIGIRYKADGSIDASGTFVKGTLVSSHYVDPAKLGLPSQVDGSRQRELEGHEQGLLRTADLQAERERAEEAQQRQRDREERQARLAEQERLRKAELQAERKRTQELEQRLRIAEQVSVSADAPRPLTPVTYARRRALVIGNDRYQSVDQLRNAVSDARAMGASLQRAGYEVSLHLDVDEKGFKQALRNFRYAVQGGDEVLFFFAGHGVEIAGANYLLPIDVRLSGTSDDRDRDQLREDSIDLKRFMSELEDRKAKFTLAVIDACRNDPFPKPPGLRSVSARQGLAQTTPATGQMIIFSAGVGQEAKDRLDPRDTSKNGLFTRIFLSEMERPGVPIDRVLKNVRTEVSRLARTVGHAQTPAIYDQSEGDFYFRLQ